MSQLKNIKKETEGRESPSFIYRFARFLVYNFFRLFWRIEFVEQDKIPLKGPLIIAANHRSYADPPVLGLMAPREVHFLAKQELFLFSPIGWLLSNLNAHPINRASGGTAIKEMQNLLEKDAVIIVFPEGTRIKTGGFGKAKPGVGLLAITTKTTVIPVYIHNSNRLFSFQKLTAVVGEAINPQGYNDYQALADRVVTDIQELRNKFLRTTN